MSGTSNPGGAGGFPNNSSQNGNQDSSGSVYVAPSLGQTPTANPGQTAIPGQAGFPGQAGGFPGQAGGFPGQPGGFPGQPGGFPGRPGMFPAQPQSGFGGQPAQMSGFGGGTDSSTQNSNTAGGLGNNFGLTNANPQMQPGLPGMGGQQIGGGIAGVASESTGPSIKTYNERKKYNEWEFVYDRSKDRGLAGVQGNGGAPGTPAGQMGSMPPGMNPQQQGGTGAPFGMNNQGGQGGAGSIFTPSTGFGQPSPQQPQN
jgi:hypothetical protein